ncbi:MAG TPA: alternative ribosome rescue aminoacyl-tRNA hydrolase ArfB [Thermoanaerobaculia bacterium]|nr:alternative ribosome rescue aminoacyl-tRNA hydrolase ArfB [Thermoanaerobaculia bacterium]
MIEIRPDLTIPESELRYVASRSSGPGGQNVNKVSSRITLLFDVESSPALSEEVRTRLKERLASRINRQGILQVSSQRYREQPMNREAALARFIELLQDALTDRPPRKKKKVPKASKRRRLEEKKRRGELKALRRGGSV